MKKNKQKFLNKLSILSLVLSVFLINTSIAEEIKYSDSWGKAGFYIEKQSSSIVKVNFSIEKFALSDNLINGETMQTLQLPGCFLPNDEGAPDLPGSGRYIAIPQGAKAVLKIISSRTETFTGIDMAPGFRIPLVTDTGSLEYKKNEKIYSRNAFYPAEPIKLSIPAKIRGVDVVILGITP
ncbi:MAG: hypothetical protein K8R58_07880, partial [Bacteroidales bacterium]|nr:hypothetical protein [Bacteroidales bacterium]